MSFSWKVLAAAAATAALLSGCSSVSLDESAKDGTLAGSASGQQTQTVTNPFVDPANALSQRSVYFAFDSYEVEPEYLANVEAHAKWLLAHPTVKIVIQGNTDERGGREYNLALGQKRSEAVKQRMQLLGVPSENIEAVSFGKEKPVAFGHSDEAWAQNRRADIVYPVEVINGLAK
ncbi:OmpA domain-containing protein [gut metagenome]|uniref:OmpA domain-containing protein n=1 Tax=gut metagenome TaxID=749906 RepID=J9GNH7_9ZZZZ